MYVLFLLLYNINLNDARELSEPQLDQLMKCGSYDIKYVPSPAVCVCFARSFTADVCTGPSSFHAPHGSEIVNCGSAAASHIYSIHLPRPWKPCIIIIHVAMRIYFLKIMKSTI